MTCAIALGWLVTGCATAPPAETRTAEPPLFDSAECEDIRLPITFAFRCLSACLDPTFADNDWRLAHTIEVLRARPGIRRIVLHGFSSTSGPEFGYITRFTLSQRRAESVRDALVRAGYDIGMIEAAGLGRYHDIAADPADECPPPDEDEPYPQRYVDISIIECGAPTDP